MKNKRVVRLMSHGRQCDALTGLYNKEFAAKKIRSYLENMRSEVSCALFVLDLDEFKNVNDYCGYEVGDALLISVGQVLEGSFRLDDIIGRIGDDEFIIFMKDIPSREILSQKAKALSEAIRKIPLLADGAREVTASIGIAMALREFVDYDELYQLAGLALQEAKFDEKGSYRIKRPLGIGEDIPVLAAAVKHEEPVDKKPFLSRTRLFYASVIGISLAAFAAALVLSVTTTYLSNRRSYSDTLLTRAEYQLERVTESIDSYGTLLVYLRNSPDVLHLLSQTPEAYGEQLVLEKEIADDIWNSIGQMDVFIGASLYRNDGRIFLQNTKMEDISEAVLQQIDVSSLDFNDKKYAISICEFQNNSVLAITSPVIDENQKILGYMYAFLRSSAYAMPKESESQDHFLFSSEDLKVACCDDFIQQEEVEDSIYRSEGLITGIKEAMSTGGHLISYTNESGIRMIGAVCKANEFPLVLVTSVHTSEMTRTVLPFTLFQGGISLVLLCILVIVIYLLFRRTTKPVSDMIEQCSQLANGNDAVEIEASHDGELKKLADAFNGYRKRLETAAYFDPLLKIGTRYKYIRDTSLLISSKKAEAFSVFLIDLKEFHKYNEVFSIQMGDEILQEISNRLAPVFGTRFYRVDGDIFLGVSMETEDIHNLSEYIHSQAEKKMVFDQAEFELGCWIGICCYPEHGESAAVLMKAAQSALHQAKLGRSTSDIVVYDEYMVEALREEEEILNLLRRRIADNTLEVWYQPIYHVKEGKYISAEALLRLKDDEGRYLSPFEAILIAEKNNFVDIVGSYVLKETCRLLKKLQKVNCDIEFIQINLSVQELAQNNFAEKALALLNSFGVEPSRLGMEITETVVIQSLSGVIEVLNKLRNSGIRIAMDDFGSGYSGLNYLSKLPIDILKLDRDLVLEVGESQQQLEFIKTVVQLAKIKKIKAVAEGVETADILGKIIECGADCIQGYYFSKPLCVEDFLQFVIKQAQ